jgi:tetratricopeptide (TPR) repeat protein
VSSTAREVRPTITANGGEAASLVESAMLLRWRAPELALLLADRAVTAAQDDRIAVLRADHLAVFALNHLGRHGEAAHRLFPAIQDADASPALRHELHVELAHCAVAVGEPVTALDAVYAVLAAGDDVAAVLRGEALVTVAEAALALGRNDLVTSALEEADELYREDPSLDRDTALLLRAAVRATDAARHRGRGATAEAEAKSREGRELLVGLADPDHDSGEVSARLMLELVLTLIGRGAGETAMQEVRSLLRRPVRAAAASSVGRLRLALATQVHLAQGRHEPALTLLADAVEGAQRYGVDAVLAECLEGLSHVHEARDEFADALHCMRAARAAEARHRRDLAAARSTLLENCGFARHVQARLLEQVTELLAPPGTGCAGLDPDSAALHVDRAQAAALEEVTGPPVAEVEPTEVEPTEAVTCEPSTSTAESNGASTALVELPVAVLPVAEEPAAVHEGEPSSGLDSWQSRARHRRGGEGTLVSVSDLLPASAMSAGRPGRRRAEESAKRNRDETHEVEKHPPVEDGSGQVQSPSDLPPRPDGDVVGCAPEQDTEAFSKTRPDSPPPAPTPRTLEWEPADGEAAPEGETPQMGLGDLLAEALAAYQESRDVRADARPTGMSRDDASATADVEASIDLARYRGSGTRWTAGLALAPSPTEPDPIDLDPSDADGGDPPEVVTNPLLRLPDLTTEPRWVPPETRRRSAAGD